MSTADLTRSSNPVAISLTVAAIAAATIAGAWFFQLVIGLVPCPLCLEQRYAYYAIIPLTLLIALLASRGASRSLVGLGLALVALAALINAAFAGYHAGVEWGWWQGPTDCSGPIRLDLGGGSLLDSIKTVKVVRCDEVQWRFLGLSLAGYNVLISLAMAGLAAIGALRSLRAR